MSLSFATSALIHWKNLTNDIPPLLIITNQEIVVFISAFVFMFWNRKSIKITEECKNYFFRVLIMAIIIFLALLFSFLGLKITDPIISSVLFLANPLATILLATLIFREKLTFKNTVAILFIALGAYILHYFSV